MFDMRKRRQLALTAVAAMLAACTTLSRLEPPEVVATIYKSLGFDLDTPLPGPAGRPFPLVDFGKQEIKELF